MAAAIWSSPAQDILDFPLPTFVRFCHNHGLLAIADRPQWRTVRGGARVYVRQDRRARCRTSASARRCTQRAPAAHGVEIDSPRGRGERFDAVVLACHSDQALLAARGPVRRTKRGCSAGPLPAEPRRAAHRRRAAAALAPRVVGVELPRRRRPGRRAPGGVSATSSTGCSRCRSATPVIVTLNPPFEPDPRAVMRRVRVLASAARRAARSPRSSAIARAAGPAPHLVRRRMAGLRVPRGRARVGARGRRRHRGARRAPRRVARASASPPDRRRRVDERPPRRQPRPTPHATRCARTAPALVARGRSMHRRTRPARQRVHLPGVLPAPAAVAARRAARARHRAQRARPAVVPRPRPRRARRFAARCRWIRAPARARGHRAPTARSCCTRSRACWATCSTR